MAPQPPRDERAALELRLAQEDALYLAAKATRDYDRITVAQGELLDVPVGELLARVRAGLRRAARQGDGAAYVGSTSDPGWRWKGGATLAEDGANVMVGHITRWQRMVVLGAWPDKRCATMEVAAIAEARLAEQEYIEPALVIANRADDARGLHDRGHQQYSFVYLCW